MNVNVPITSSVSTIYFGVYWIISRIGKDKKEQIPQVDYIFFQNLLE